MSTADYQADADAFGEMTNQYTGLGGDCTNCGEEEHDHDGGRQLCRPGDVEAFRETLRRDRVARAKAVPR